MNLKTESIFHIKQTGQTLQSGEYVVNLSADEPLVARVEQKQGDSVVLRNNQNGTLINASMGSGADISSGDLLEMAVSKNSDGYLLYIMDIAHSGVDSERQYTRDSLPDALAAMKTNSGLSPKTAAFLAENNIQITPENIEELRSMIRSDSGFANLLSDMLSETFPQQVFKETANASSQAPGYSFTAQEAAISSDDTVTYAESGVKSKNTSSDDITFLKEGGTESAAAQAAPENPETVYIFNEDTTPGGNSVIDTAAQSPKAFSGTEENVDYNRQAAFENACASASNAGIDGFPNVSEDIPWIGNYTAKINGGGNKGSGQAEISGEKSAGTGQIPEEISGEKYSEPIIRGAVQTALNVKSGDTIAAAAPSLTQTEQSDIFDEISVGTAMAGAVKESVLKTTEGLNRLIKKEIKEILVRPYEQTGEQIKKAVMEMPGKLNLLKLLMNRTDNKDKDTYIDKMEQAQKQLKLGSEFNRFYYIELPFMTQNGQLKQAELYIQKNTGGREKEDASESVVLISLSTQNIGVVETLIRAKKGSVSLEFRIERKEMQQEFKKHERTLAKAMKEAGYNLSGFSVTGLETKTTVINAGKLFAEESAPRTGKIDVQI